MTDRELEQLKGMRESLDIVSKDLLAMWLTVDEKQDPEKVAELLRASDGVDVAIMACDELIGDAPEDEEGAENGARPHQTAADRTRKTD